MSWLARSIANSLRIDDDDDDHNPHSDDYPSPSQRHPVEDAAEEGGDLRGVKDDLTELKQSLSRQLWGVANFLAPPPTPEVAHDHRVEPESNKPESSYDDGEEEEDKLRDVKEDEIYDYDYNSNGNGDKYVDEDEEEEWRREVGGVREEVLTFARDIAHHPETWLDFPLHDDSDDFDDFPMSEPQKRHTQAIEHLTPRLAALRIELCPAHMSVGFFWKVYFVLVHSRLNKQDAELLSTPQVVEARIQWMQELQKRAKKESESFYGGHYGGHCGGADFDEDLTPRSLQNEHSETMSSWTFASEPTTSSTTADSDTEKQVSTEMNFTDKSVTDEKPLTETEGKNTHPAPLYMKPALKFDDDDDDDDWPEDDCLGHSGKVIPVGIDEDISFSDLEDDDCCIPIISKPDFEV